MGILFQFLLALFLPAFVEAAGPPLWVGIAALAAAYFAAGRALAGSFAGLVERAAERDAADPGAAVALLRRAVALHRWAALLCHGLLLGPGGWGTLAADVADRWGEGAGIAAAFAPWPLLLVLSVASTHPGEHRAGLAASTLRTTYGRNLRLLLLMILPIVILLAVRAAALAAAAAGIEPFFTVEEWAARWDILSASLFVGSLAAVSALFPVAGMALLGARPLPPGPLRTRLETYAARAGLRYRDLYVWNTGGGIVNAAVLGVGARLRCVVFTDALLERLDDDEIEAVFAHEAGHAVHHHLPLFFLYTVGSLLAMSALPRVLPTEWSAAVQTSEGLQGAVFLLGVVLYFGLVFGFVSRRLEQQADVHGLLTVGLPPDVDPAAALAEPGRHPFVAAVDAGEAAPRDHPFVRSLERIARVAGGVREITGWRHFSIADRVAFAERFLSDGAVRRTYARRLRLLLAVGGVGLLCIAAVAAADLAHQRRGPHPSAALERAVRALERGDFDAARAWIADGAEGALARGLALASVPRVQSSGRPVLELAALEWSAAAADPGTDPAGRVRAGMLDALALGLLGRPGDALNAAAHDAAWAAAQADGETVPWRRRRIESAAAAAHLLWGDLLSAAGRPAAAAAAWSLARERAERADDTVLVGAADGRR